MFVQHKVLGCGSDMQLSYSPQAPGQRFSMSLVMNSSAKCSLSVAWRGYITAVVGCDRPKNTWPKN